VFLLVLGLLTEGLRCRRGLGVVRLEGLASLNVYNQWAFSVGAAGP
jgi:hypothetical protein